jgi:hypothetical protein
MLTPPTLGDNIRFTCACTIPPRENDERVRIKTVPFGCDLRRRRVIFVRFCWS